MAGLTGGMDKFASVSVLQPVLLFHWWITDGLMQRALA